MRKAVIDVGSNSVLLTVEEESPEGWKPVCEQAEVTALGEGTKQTGRLSPEGVTRTLQTLKDYFEQARTAGAESVCAYATMAVRIAEDRESLLEPARKQGTPVEVLSGEDEARYGFLAVAGDPLFNAADRLSIIDPGGHSTELVTAQRQHHDWTTLFRRSFPVGTLALRGGLLADESPKPLDLLRACADIDDRVGLCYLPNQAGVVVTLGATGTNLVSIREKLPSWQPEKVHGATLTYEEISRAVSWLCGMTDAERAALPGIEKGRERTIHLGALTLERFMFAARAEACRVSVRGWRHAILEA